ncbi:hypothetical protein ACFRMQ_21210 [Kitasatospora sp. NPDC056783]|uniref:hypothetical protein n=1 Tax=Kitasatospora sp. NPDC056783 TaxID=3345943 RepID=UPI0036B75ED8
MTIEAQTLTRAGIQEIYGIQVGLLNQWVANPAFPDHIDTARHPDQGRAAAHYLYDAAAVDAFVKDHDRLQWLRAHEGADAAEQELRARLPRGNPADLLTRKEFGEVFGNFTRGKPLGDSTMRSYLAREQIPQPDRHPDDGQEPQVYEPHWYRGTIYRYLLDLPGRGGRGKGRTRTAGAPSDRSLVGTLPAGDPGDLLTIEQAGVIVGNFARGKPYPRVTMNGYKTAGRIPAPDRMPGDGRQPEVKEPRYLRSTVHAMAEAQSRVARG